MKVEQLVERVLIASCDAHYQVAIGDLAVAGFGFTIEAGSRIGRA
jgi:hypothetical protein